MEARWNGGWNAWVGTYYELGRRVGPCAPEVRLQQPRACNCCNRAEMRRPRLRQHAQQLLVCSLVPQAQLSLTVCTLRSVYLATVGVRSAFRIGTDCTQCSCWTIFPGSEFFVFSQRRERTSGRGRGASERSQWRPPGITLRRRRCNHSASITTPAAPVQ